MSERSRAHIPHTTSERCRLTKVTEKKQRLSESLTTTPIDDHAQNRTKLVLQVGVDTAHHNAVGSNSTVSKVSTQHVREVGEIGKNASRCLVFLHLWIDG